MNEKDIQWLVKQIIGTAEALGQQITATSAAILAEDLEVYPREILAKSLSRVRTEHTGKLTLKAIIDRIDEAMGRPAANEAWSVALGAMDERQTVVWTNEMAQAWAVAQPIAQNRDMVGARMAFISAYERLVRTAREERRLPEVSVSIGWDASLRTKAVEQAVSLGYLRQEQAVEYLPPPAATFNPMALLEGKPVQAPPEIKERLSQLREQIIAANERDRIERERKKQAAAKDLADRKAAAQAMTERAIIENEALFVGGIEKLIKE
jgi:hypothetical protein